jgi:hypothetical protein
MAGMQAQAYAMANPGIQEALAHGDMEKVRYLVGALKGTAEKSQLAGDKYETAHKLILADMDANPNLSSVERERRNMAILNGKNPDEPGGGAAGKAEADADAVAKVNLAKQRGQPVSPQDHAAAEEAQARIDARANVKVSEATKKSEAGAITDDAANLIAERQLAGDERASTGMARSQANITKVANAIVTLARQRGMSGADIAAKVAEFQGTTAGERTLGTRTANMEVAANEVKNMAPLALAASREVKRTDYPSLNNILLAGERGTGDSEVVRFGLAANSLIYTYAKFLNPTGIPTDSDKARATDILSTAWSNGQFEAAVDQIKREIASGQGAIGATRSELHETVTGRSSGPGGQQTQSQQFKEGQIYTDAKGNKAKYVGGKWEPVQ